MLVSDVCLTSDVCLAYVGPKSRKERPRKTKIGTGVAYVTRDSDTTFKVKRSKVKVTRPLYSPRHGGTYWAWETTATLRCARRRFGAHRGRRGAGAYRGGRPPTACFILHSSWVSPRSRAAVGLPALLYISCRAWSL